MGLNGLINAFINGVISFFTDHLMPGMVGIFLMAILLKWLIYYTVKRHQWFAYEFEKRVNRFLETRDPKEPVSFYVTLKKLMEKTFYEIFEVRSRMQRRRPDRIMDLSDRVFLIRQGTAWVIRDTLKRIKTIRYTDKNHPDLLQISKNILQSNPCFNRVFGIIPAAPLNDILNLMPGTFIVAGIFGTFLGIMEALPDLGGMDLSDPEQSKQIMDQFLISIAFAMSTSLLGIMLSVTSSFANTVLAPEKLFAQIVDKFENSLNIIWHLSDNNDAPIGLKDFDEYRDPIEALAEEVLIQELKKGRGQRELDSTVDPRKKQEAS